jgi:hypothetical protein
MVPVQIKCSPFRLAGPAFSQILGGADEQSSGRQLPEGAVALFGQKNGHGHLPTPFLRKSHHGVVQRADLMQDVAGLVFVPPAEVFDLDADLVEGGLGLLDLNLRAAMCQQEGHVAVQKYFHQPPGLAGRLSVLII